MQPPFEALKEFYNPPHISRVGLRYIDVIKRSALDLEGVPWSELLQTHAIGLNGATDIKDDIESSDSKYIIKLGRADCMARLIIALVQKDDEKCLVVDTDFYNTVKCNVDEVFEVLDYFHKQASNLIQWLIQPRLHTAMLPEEIK